MISNNKYDYIICGGGASGLLLSNALISDSFFDNKKILIIEKEAKVDNDKSFSFWDNESNILDRIVFKSWEKAEFKDSEFSSSFNLSPYKYKMVRSDRLNELLNSESLNYAFSQDLKTILSRILLSLSQKLKDLSLSTFASFSIIRIFLSSKKLS